MDELSKLNLYNNEHNIEKIKDNNDDIIDENNEDKDIDDEKNEDILNKEEINKQKQRLRVRTYNHNNREKLKEIRNDRRYNDTYYEKHKDDINKKNRDLYDAEKKQKKHDYYLKKKEKRLQENK
jgi:hypothetical protein